MALVQLKTINRNIQLSLDSQRKEIELKKNTVDKLQLNLENYLYRQAYLKRDIRECRDVSTPNLDEIERETGIAMGTKLYRIDLEEVNQSTLEALDFEKELRLAAQAELEQALQRNKEVIEQLDRKRKFLDDLPLKMKLIKDATAELHEQFRNIVSDTTKIADDSS